MVGGSEKEDRTVNTSFSLGVQLVLKRGATTLSSLNKEKSKNKKNDWGRGRHCFSFRGRSRDLFRNCVRKFRFFHDLTRVLLHGCAHILH